MPGASGAGDFTIRTPSLARTSSNTAVNFASRSRMRNRNEPIRSARSMSRLRACWAVQILGHSEDMHRPGHYLQDEQHVQASQEDRVHGEEVARQQALCLGLQESPPGGVQAARSGTAAPGAEIRRTVASLMWRPRRVSSPCTRRYPQAGFSPASRSARSRISAPVTRRSGRPGYVHLRVIRRRCQASRVPGVTRRLPHSAAGSSRASAARIARSAQSGLGRVTWRRSTITS
jgi:hypothetical protein